MLENQPSTIARFGPFKLDLVSGELCKYSTKPRLGEQPFQILSLLLARCGQLVTREELHNRLWPSHTFVDFDHGLNSAISRLRETLSDLQQEPRWVETLPRRGYRFIGKVEWGVPGSNGQEEHSRTQRSEAESAQKDRDERRVDLSAAKQRNSNLMAVGFGLAATMLLGAWGAHKLEIYRGTLRSAPMRTLAVLLLENLSGDAGKEYFADGNDR